MDLSHHLNFNRRAVNCTKVTRKYGANKDSFVETGTLTLVSDLDHLKEAQQTVLERDTGIYIGF